MMSTLLAATIISGRPARGVLLQLGIDGLEVLHRVPALGAGHIHHVDQQPAAVHMAQKVVAQAGTVGGALDDTGDIGHDEGDPSST